MKKTYFQKAKAFMLSSILIFLSCSFLFPCSTFLLKKGNVLLAGHNLDERHRLPGLVWINKRNLAKTAISWKALTSGKPDAAPPLGWTSKYASVTFNLFGG